MLFRIVGVDNENNIKAVSEKGVTLLYSGLENGYDTIIDLLVDDGNKKSSRREN